MSGLLIFILCMTSPSENARAAGERATGGTVTNYVAGGTNWTAHVFEDSGTFSLTGGMEVEYLVVAGGGGGGGGYQGGGGGAGGFLTGTIKLKAGTYPVVVGAGGTGSGVGKYPSNGKPSSFGALSALGGGSGASEAPTVEARNGGSGGGGSHPRITAGNGTDGQGHGGGKGLSNREGFTGGGGGGAGGPGTDASAGMSKVPGGAGKSSSISGSAVSYAAGGMGRKRKGRIEGDDAPGHSGNGGDGGAGGPGVTGGNGGSGIVIVRYEAWSAKRGEAFTLVIDDPGALEAGPDPIVTEPIVIGKSRDLEILDSSFTLVWKESRKGWLLAFRSPRSSRTYGPFLVERGARFKVGGIRFKLSGSTAEVIDK